MTTAPAAYAIRTVIACSQKSPLRALPSGWVHDSRHPERHFSHLDPHSTLRVNQRRKVPLPLGDLRLFA